MVVFRGRWGLPHDLRDVGWSVLLCVFEEAKCIEVWNLREMLSYGEERWYTQTGTGRRGRGAKHWSSGLLSQLMEESTMTSRHFGGGLRGGPLRV